MAQSTQQRGLQNAGGERKKKEQVNSAVATRTWPFPIWIMSNCCLVEVQSLAQVLCGSFVIDRLAYVVIVEIIGFLHFVLAWYAVWCLSQL